MSYYDVDPVPSFKALTASKGQDSKPLQLKFLHDTPLQLHRGLNMLMPAARPAETTTSQDEPMNVAPEEGPVAMEVEVVTELATPNPPPPPMDPILEDFDEEMEPATEKNDQPSERITSAVVTEEEKEDKEPSTGYAGTSARGPPVVLTPARPEPDQSSQRKFVPPRPKSMPKASAETPNVQAEKTEQPVEVKKEPEETSSTTKMTSEVKQVPKRPEAKSRPPQGKEPSSSNIPNPSPAAETTTTYASSSVGPAANIPIGQTDDTSGDLWADYRGTGRDVRDEPNDPQYVETAKGVLRVPTPPRPSREGEEGVPQDAAANIGKGKGTGTTKGKWRPVLDPQNDPQRPDKGASRSRFLNQPSGSDTSQGKGKEKGPSKGKGKKGKGGKNKQVWTYTEEYIPTNLWGDIGRVREDLRWYFPDEYDHQLSNFWQDDYDHQWYVRRIYWWTIWSRSSTERG